MDGTPNIHSLFIAFAHACAFSPPHHQHANIHLVRNADESVQFVPEIGWVARQCRRKRVFPQFLVNCDNIVHVEQPVVHTEQAVQQRE